MPSEHCPTVIAIVGPTGSGKTALSLKLAEHFGAEIIACDCRTVYRYFDIGTAKPSPTEQRRIRHHLIDVAEPEDNYSVAHFTRQAAAAIADISKRALMPIVCGGTGFYFRALLEGLEIPAVPPQSDLRLTLTQLAEREGNQVLHQRLSEVDPVTAARLNANDRFRIIRALEVYTVLKQPFSQAVRKCEPPFKTIWIGLTARDRNHLYAQIQGRFEQQLEAGLLEETERLYARYGAHQKLMHTVNYKELVGYLEGKIDQETAFKAALTHNKQLARRQLIWFRANQKIMWFATDSLSKGELESAAREFIQRSV